MEEEIWFQLEIHTAETPTTLSARIIEIFFNVGAQKYLLSTHQSGPEATPGPDLFRVDAQGETRWLSDMRHEFAENSYQFFAPREHLWDENGAVLAPGHQISEFYASLTGSRTRAAGILAYPFDELPNEPTTAFLKIETGTNQSSSLQLTSTYPSRYSNGEDASFVYPFTALNLGSTEEVIRFSWETPDDWTAQISSNGVTVPAGGQYDGFLVANVPFKHNHGSTEKIVLLAENSAGDQGEILFQIRFLGVPQPAGHHNEVFLHSRTPGADLTHSIIGGGPYAYMNTLAEDPESSGDSVRAASNGRPLDELTWTIPLTPSLLLGLDSPGGEGRFSGVFSSQIPHLDAVLEASLLHQTNAFDTVLAHGTSTPLDLMPGELASFAVPLEMVEITLPPQDGAQLVLRLQLHVTQPTFLTAQEIPLLLPGASFSVPLNEYRDSPEDIPGLLSSTLVAAPFSQDLEANARSVLVLKPTVSTNQSDPISVTLHGNGAEHGTVVGGPFLEPESPLEVPVVLEIPETATVGEVFDVLVVFAQNDQHTYARFITTIVAGPVEDMRDEASKLLGSEREEAPMPFAWALVLLVFARKWT